MVRYQSAGNSKILTYISTISNGTVMDRINSPDTYPHAQVRSLELAAASVC